MEIRIARLFFALTVLTGFVGCGEQSGDPMDGFVVTPLSMEQVQRVMKPCPSSSPRSCVSFHIDPANGNDQANGLNMNIPAKSLCATLEKAQIMLDAAVLRDADADVAFLVRSSDLVIDCPLNLGSGVHIIAAP